MEAAGLAFGVAPIFSTCIDVIEKVDAYRDFGVDSDAAKAQFNADKSLLKKWGRDVGLDGDRLLPDHSESLDEAEVADQVKGILRSIQALCGKLESTLDRGLKPLRRIPTGEGTLDRGLKPLRRIPTGHSSVSGGHIKGDGISVATKVGWAFRGRARTASKLEQLGALIQRLFELVPPDPSLGKLWDSIQAQREADKYNAIKSWLAVQETTDVYDRARRRRLDETCSWILDRDFFTEWTSEHFSHGRAKVLWVHGHAGYGKTVLCARITEYLSALADHPPIAFYFISAGTESQASKPFVVFKSWLHQLVVQSPVALQIAHDFWESQQALGPSQEDVVSLLKLVFQQVDYCTLIVDGLDECTWPDPRSPRVDDRDRDSVGGFFDTVAEILAQSQATRVLLVSRQEAYLKSAFDLKISANKEISVYQHSIQPSDVQADAAVVSTEIVRRKLPNKSDEQKAELAQKMLDKSEGMFLWMKMLEGDLSEAKNKKKLLQLVEQTPTAIDHLYDRNWARIMSSAADQQQRALSILSWVVAGPRPLTVLELTEALMIPDDVDDDAAELDDDELPDAIDEPYVQSGIVDVCASFVEIRRAQENDAPIGSSTVHIVHFSARQYLLKVLPVHERLHLEDKRLFAGLRPDTATYTAYLSSLCLMYLGTRSVWIEEFALGTDGGFRPFISVAMCVFALLARRTDTTPLPERTKAAIFKLLDPLRDFWHYFTTHTWRAGLPSEWAPRIDARELTGNETGRFVAGSPVCFAAWIGFDLLEYFLTHTAIPWSMPSEGGWTALHVACARDGRGEALVKLLLEHGADANASTIPGGISPLLIAAYFGRVGEAEVLLKHGAEQSKSGNREATPLHGAAFKGHLDMVKLLIDRGADLSATDKYGNTALHEACRANQVDVASLLLEHGAEQSKSGDRESTPLHGVAFQGHLDMVKLLIERGADASATDKLGDTALHAACRGKQVVVASLLLEHGATFEARNEDGRSPLWYVLDSSMEAWKALLPSDGIPGLNERDKEGRSLLHQATYRADWLRLLLVYQPQLEAQDANGWTAVHYAAARGRKDCLELLLDEGADAEAREKGGYTPLHKASGRGHADCVKILLAGGAQIEACDEANSWKPLHAASHHGHADCIKILLAAGAQIEVTDADGDTPLHLASNNGHTDCIKILLAAGAQIKATNAEGWNPLLLASNNGHADCIKILLAAGAQIKAINAEGWNPLLLASSNGHTDCIKILLAAGAQIKAIDADGDTPLHLASRNGHTDCIKILLAAGAQIEATNAEGWNPLLLASNNGHADCIKILLAAGAQVEATDADGYTPLHLASGRGHIDCVKVLLDKAATLNPRDDRDSTPLREASNLGRVACAELLVDRGAHAMARTNCGTTALHLAAMEGHSEIIQLLVNSGADAMARDNYGRTALHHAAMEDHSKIIQLKAAHIPDIGLFNDTMAPTPLSLAAEYGDCEALKTLLALLGTGSVARTDVLGRKVLSYAVRSGRENVVDLVLSLGGSGALDQDMYGVSALASAVANDYQQLALKLLDSTLGEFDSRDKMGRPLLWWTRKSGNESLAARLREEAARRQVSLFEPPVSPCASRRPASGADKRTASCDVCMTYFRSDDVYYYACGVCMSGNFCICEECLSLGASCFGAYHVLNRYALEAESASS